MQKSQAEAIVDAILEPGVKAQEDLRRKREAERRSLAKSRFTAAFVLVGFVVGATAAYLAGNRFTFGGLWGAICGAAIGQIIGTWHGRRRAA